MREYTNFGIGDLMLKVGDDVKDYKKLINLEEDIAIKFGTDITVTDSEDTNCKLKVLNSLLGFHCRKLNDKNFVFLGLESRFEWEYPIFWLIYWDGTKLRGYVPLTGNRYNEQTKAALGNNSEKDLEAAKDQWPTVFENYKHEIVDFAHIPDIKLEVILRDIKNNFKLVPSPQAQT